MLNRCSNRSFRLFLCRSDFQNDGKKNKSVQEFISIETEKNKKTKEFAKYIEANNKNMNSYRGIVDCTFKCVNSDIIKFLECKFCCRWKAVYEIREKT